MFSTGGIQGSIIQGGQGGGWAPQPGPPGAWSSGGQWSQWYNQGIPPPVQFGYQQWPAAGGYPQGSPFNNGGVNSFGNTCSNSQQAVSCCDGGDSSGLLGTYIPITQKQLNQTNTPSRRNSPIHLHSRLAQRHLLSIRRLLRHPGAERTGQHRSPVQLAFVSGSPSSITPFDRNASVRKMVFEEVSLLELGRLLSIFAHSL